MRYRSLIACVVAPPSVFGRDEGAEFVALFLRKSRLGLRQTLDGRAFACPELRAIPISLRRP